MPLPRTLCLSTLALALAACSTAPPAPPCEPGLTPMTSEWLYFGAARPHGGAVTAAEWQAFLDEVVTPRFSSGLTVVSASGQWKT